MITRRFPWLLLVAALTMSGCAQGPRIVRPSASPRLSASTSPSPSPTPSPSPSPSLSPTPKPKPKPPHTEPPPRALKCTGTATIDRDPAGGWTPDGTTKTTRSEAVALTFDDGPDPVNTPKVLDLLKQCGVKATFCVEGRKAQANPSMIRRIHAEGHTLCNHTWRHNRYLGEKELDVIRKDLTDTINAIKAIVPAAEVSYFRAPGGFWTDRYIKVCEELGMTPIHWAVDTRDWEFSKWGRGQSMVNHIVSSLKNDTRPGSIVLMHDYQKPDTTAALRVALPWLKARFKLIALPPGGIPLP